MNTRFLPIFIGFTLLMVTLIYFNDDIIRLTLNNPLLNISVMTLGFIVFIHIPDVIYVYFLNKHEKKYTGQFNVDLSAESFIKAPPYMVMKTKDISHGLTREEQSQLMHLFSKVWASRNETGKADLICVVVESDTPEYAAVLEMIQKRVDKEGGV